MCLILNFAHFILELRPRRTRPNANDGGRAAAVEAGITGKFNFENPCITYRNFSLLPRLAFDCGGWFILIAHIFHRTRRGSAVRLERRRARRRRPRSRRRPWRPSTRTAVSMKITSDPPLPSSRRTQIHRRNRRSRLKNPTTGTRVARRAKGAPRRWTSDEGRQIIITEKANLL